MKQRGPGPRRLVYENREVGFIMIVAVIIIGAVVSVILVSTALSSLTQLEVSNSFARGVAVQYFTEGCLQEALIRMNWDENYIGGAFNYHGGTCTVVVSGAGGNRTLGVTGSFGGYTQDLSVDVTLSPFMITDWDN